MAAEVGSDAVRIAVTREGTGPEVLLVHGGASPATTWSGLEPLRERWTLAYAYRRGFGASPAPPGGRGDFEVDAADLDALLADRPHVVAHSYGAVGAVIAATRRPTHVRSLTLVEPALFVPRGDPVVESFRRLGETVLTEGLDADPDVLREFLTAAGAPVPDDGPLPEAVVHSVRRSHGSRGPWEARPELDAVREAGIPVLVASGDHHPAAERMCDAVATALEAERIVAPGAGHFVAAAPGFAERLERFLAGCAR